MHKKYWILAAALSLTALLVGCGPAQSTIAPSGEEQQSAESSASEPAKNPFSTKAPQEEEKTVTLTAEVNGSAQSVEAVIHEGIGYQISIVKGWDRDANSAEWSARENEDVELNVRFYNQKKTDEVLEAFIKDQDDYTFEEPSKTDLPQVKNVTELYGTDMDDGVMEELIAYFIEVEKGTYGILLECPSDVSEQYGGYLAAMANSFTLTEGRK